MLNFDNLDLYLKKNEDEKKEENKKTNIERVKFYNSLYNKDDLTSYIVVEKKRKIEKKVKENKNS